MDAPFADDEDLFQSDFYSLLNVSKDVSIYYIECGTCLHKKRSKNRLKCHSGRISEM